MTDHELILVAREYDRDSLEDGIRRLFNCEEAETDAEGDVWIRGPQEGHWLGEDGLAKVAEAIRAGDI